MLNESKYKEITKERIDKLGFEGNTREMVEILLYWSYVEGGRDAEKETFAKLTKHNKK